MNKKDLSEQEIRTRFIMPALRKAGWDLRQIREEYYFTEGRMHIQGAGLTEQVTTAHTTRERLLEALLAGAT